MKAYWGFCFFVVLALCLTGCSPIAQPMTNEEVVAAVKYCHDNGFDAEQWRRFGWDGATVIVHCAQRSATPRKG